MEEKFNINLFFSIININQKILYNIGENLKELRSILEPCIDSIEIDSAARKKFREMAFGLIKTLSIGSTFLVNSIETEKTTDKLNNLDAIPLSGVIRLLAKLYFDLNISIHKYNTTSKRKRFATGTVMNMKKLLF